MKTPSTSLLQAILRPVSTCRARNRASSTGRNVTALEKLHRKQKEAIRQERLASIERAQSNPNLTSKPPPATAATANTTVSATTTASPTSSLALLDTPFSEAAPTLPTLPYTISRTRPGHQLPIYNLTKGGGTKHITRLRKISGDLQALKADLTKALRLEGGMTNRRGENVEGVSVNWQTSHIIVRGWRGPEIKAWAESRGF